MFQIQKGDGLYRLVGPGGEEGEPVTYGYPAIVEVGEKTYLVYCEEDEEIDEEVEDLLFCLSDEPVSITEDVSFVDENGAALVIEDDEDDEDDDPQPEADEEEPAA